MTGEPWVPSETPTPAPAQPIPGAGTNTVMEAKFEPNLAHVAAKSEELAVKIAAIVVPKLEIAGTDGTANGKQMADACEVMWRWVTADTWPPTEKIL